MSSFLPSTRGQGSEQRHLHLTVRQRGRIFWGKPFWLIITAKATKRQVKETVPTWSQNWLPPCNRKRRWCWERLKAGGEGDDRGWESWMASPTQWNELERAPEVGDGQGSLACCSPWGHKESDTTEWLNCKIHNADTQCTEGPREAKEQKRILKF